MDFEPHFTWIDVACGGDAASREVYGFVGSQDCANRERVPIRPASRPSTTLLVFIHPSSTAKLLPLSRRLAQAGAHALCAVSHYARHGPALPKKVFLELGAYFYRARSVWGYEGSAMVGWSGGASLALFYRAKAEAEAEKLSMPQSSAGNPLLLVCASFTAAVAVTFQAAHISRARLLLDSLGTSVRVEGARENSDPVFDLYAANSIHPAYPADLIAHQRGAQRARTESIPQRVKAELALLVTKARNGFKRSFITHRTFADLLLSSRQSLRAPSL